MYTVEELIHLKHSCITGGRKPESIVSVQSIAQIRGGIPECVLKPNSQVWGFGVGGASYYRG